MQTRTTQLPSWPLLRLRDRREERRARREATQPGAGATATADTTSGLRPGEHDAAIERVLAMLPPPRADQRGPAGAQVIRAAVAPAVLPSLAEFAVAVSAGALHLDRELVFGARAGQGVALGGRRWAGLAPTEVETGMRDAIADGTVLVMRQVRDLVPLGRDLADAVARAARARTDINVYVSAAEGCGFSPHDDDHDVLVVQCTGQRRWTLWEGGRPFPLRRDVDPAFDVPPGGKVAVDVDLAPGDVLYIPRGSWHVVDRARTVGGQPSLHMSIGIYRLTGLDLLEWLLARVVRDEVVRADLPLGSGSDRLAAYIGQVAERVAVALADVRAEHCALVMAEVQGMLPLLEVRHPRRPATTGDAVLSCCAHPVELFDVEGEAVFHAGGRRWQVPPGQREWFERLLNTTEADPVLVESLDDDGLVATEQLASAGLVQIVR